MRDTDYNIVAEKASCPFCRRCREWWNVSSHARFVCGKKSKRAQGDGGPTRPLHPDSVPAADAVPSAAAAHRKTVSARKNWGNRRDHPAMSDNHPEGLTSLSRRG